MEIFSEFTISVNNAWLFSSVYLIINTGLILLFPKYNINKFVKTPKLKYVTNINLILFLLQIILTIFLPLKLNSLIYYVEAAGAGAGHASHAAVPDPTERVSELGRRV